jgi:hypothetical protein
MTVERAIRRLAGSLVLAGMGLGLLVSPWFYIIPLFVGANLFQSSFTGFCPAEQLLVKMGVGCSVRSTTLDSEASTG